MKPDNFTGYMMSDGGYRSELPPSIYGIRPLYRIVVRWKENKCSLVYRSDCPMFVVEA